MRCRVYFMYSYLFLKKAFSVNYVRMENCLIYLEIRKLAKKVPQYC